MATVMKGNASSFVMELIRYYKEAWEIPESSLLNDPDLIVEDSKERKTVKVSFIDLDDGEPIGVIYGVYATPVEST